LSQDFKPAVNTGTYGDMNARDERFWAATELYKLTGDNAFLEDAKAVKPARFNAPTWGNVAGLGAWAWIAQEGSELHSQMLAQLKDYCEALVANVGTSSFQAPFGDKKSDFGWGCLAEGGCDNGVALMFADRYLERGKYMRYALENAVIGMVCEERGEEDLLRLEQNLEMQRLFYRSGAMAEFKKKDDEFHRSFFEITRKMEVYHLMQRLQVHFDRVRRLSLSVVPHEAIIEDHERIVNCIRNQDIPQARAQLKTHLERYQIDAATIQTAYPQYFKPNPTQEG
jgi:hypothetical protein